MRGIHQTKIYQYVPGSISLYQDVEQKNKHRDLTTIINMKCTFLEGIIITTMNAGLHLTFQPLKKCIYSVNIIFCHKVI